MKLAQKPQAEMKKINLPKKPLVEGIIPLNSHGHRDWKSVSDEELVGFAKGFIEEKKIGGRKELRKADSGLYEALRKRKLLYGIGLWGKQRHWASFSDDELTGVAKKFIEEKKISGRKELEKADAGLYQALWKRTLLECVGLEEKQRDWAAMSDDELVGFVKRFIEEKEIGGRMELAKAEYGLYRALGKRKLLDSVGLSNSNAEDRSWASLSDDELLVFAKRFIEEKEIDGRAELNKADKGLYDALRKRKLLDTVFPQAALDRRRESRNWASMSDDDLVGFAKEFIREKGIRGRTDLDTADSGLYQVLGKRKLLDAVGLEEKRRDWASLSDDELVGFAKEFIREKGIRGRKELAKADGGLYDVLWRRELLDSVFSSFELENQTSALTEIIDSVREFGGAE